MKEKIKNNPVILFFYRLLKVMTYRIIFSTPIYKIIYPHKIDTVIDNNKKYRLVVCHNRGGGTGSYMKNKYGNEPGVLFFKKIYAADKDYLYCLENSDNHNIYYFNPSKLSDIKINLSEINIVAVESFMSLVPLFNWFKAFNVPITYDIHDYHCIWYEAHFVHNGKLLSKDDLQNSVLRYIGTKITFAQWHKAWMDFFPSVTKINAFSESSKQIFSECYPDFADKVQVTPHSLEYIKCGTLKSIPEKFTVGIFGMIQDFDKGSSVVKSFLEFSKNKDYEVYINGALRQDCMVEAQNIKYMGRYDVNNLDKIIEDQGISVVFFPSVCPETFSYTISELIHVGVPVACFNTGAQAEKVSNYKFGEIIQKPDSEEILKSLQNAFQKGLNCKNQ